MNPKRILVATDFSTRSERALRRGTLLAKALGAKLSLVHVIDDDQPKRIVAAERAAAADLLNEFVQTLQQSDGLVCDGQLVEGDPFEGIARAGEAAAADLVVIGPHRRQALKDVFVGTTAERAVRTSRRPILMANGVASGPYRQALVAVDFSQCSRDTLGVIQHLGLEQLMAISVVHVFDASETSVMKRSAVGDEHLQDYLEEEQQRALLALDGFLAEAHFKPIQRLVKHNDSSTAHVIHEAAREISADLLVVGTHGRTGIAKFLLGSVAQEVLRSATFDVLVARHFASS